MKHKKSQLAVVVLLFMLVGCAAKQIHPGSPNAFDSATYDSLLATHSVIESTKTDLANNAFPASIAGNVKTALNLLVESYNIADGAYQTYHSAALAGNQTIAQQTAVTNSVNDMNTKVTALTSAKAAK